MTKTCSEVYVLIPSHSLEDFPQDLGERLPAACWSFCHRLASALLATAGRIPQWYRADLLPNPHRAATDSSPTLGRLVSLRLARAIRASGAGLLITVARREENLQQLQAWLESDADDSAKGERVLSAGSEKLHRRFSRLRNHSSATGTPLPTDAALQQSG